MLDTACRVFSQSSYRGATTAEIAREAGISEPILYRHFGSKRDLYLACLDEAWRSFRELAEQRDRRRARDDVPRGDHGRVHGEAREASALIDLWIQALTEAGEDAVIAKALRKQIREVHDFFADVIRDGQAAGVRRTPTAIRSPRRGSSSRAACSRRWTAGSAASSATTSSASAPSAAAGCRRRPRPERTGPET